MAAVRRFSKSSVSIGLSLFEAMKIDATKGIFNGCS